MRRWHILFLVGGLGWAGGDLQGALKTQARLVLAADTARAGQTVMAGIQLTMEPGWHIYWRNSGESGSPTAITWTLPAGVTAGEIQWPVPEKLTESDLTTYIYKKEVVLLAPLTLAKELPPGNLALKAKVSWLECEQQCVPGEMEARANLNIGEAAKSSSQSNLFAEWQGRLAEAKSSFKVQAQWDQPPGGNSRAVIVEWNTENAPPFSDFFPYPNSGYEVQPAVATLPSEAGKARLRLVVKKQGEAWPNRITGLLVAASGSDQLKSGVSSKISSPPGSGVNAPNSTEWGKELAAAPASAQTVDVGKESAPLKAYEVTLDIQGNKFGATSMVETQPQSLLLMLVYAFLGGLILNVMPCVLPVIALKILGFVNQSRQAPEQVRRLGCIYAAGVLVSFLVLAALVIGVKLAGHQAGWGMQFGNPPFIILLTALVTLVALNLFGLFEINPGSQVLGVAGDLSAQEGGAGAFFNGVLATILATPCTAPFLGAALGFAVFQPPAVIVLMFLTVGLGLAAPYVLLSWQPAWLKYLPKPGVWMEKFKIAMGFPMLGTAIWLFSLTPRLYGRKTILWLGLFLVMLALTAWIYGEFIQRGRRRKALAGFIVAVLLAANYGYVLEGQLQWRSPQTTTGEGASLKESADGIDWQPWSAEAVAKARTEGRPVLVDFTADWCLTCQGNKKISLEIPSVRAKLKDLKAVALLGDYTTLPPVITAELNRYGRAGVPLVLVYPKQAHLPAIVLPEVLTPQRVLSALDEAAKM